ncbi:hypothetical protein [Thalassomonas actiniarum]|uniref:Uncharacterized protein n=1 Tax=Thalassomonas actiniarum TaxID=485447 RepID=A0AAE9YHH0_9GAMM|nr:hypothetical protein [Thalassomonas actiniarum]WDD96679.1 hypothetical protein SG35_014960 [Thalassomonas actiniarum]
MLTRPVMANKAISVLAQISVIVAQAHLLAVNAAIGQQSVASKATSRILVGGSELLKISKP